MLHMDDYYDVVECLPADVNKLISEIKQLDLQEQKSTRSLEHPELDYLGSTDKTDARAESFLSNAKNMTKADKGTEFKKIKKQYARALEIADKKAAKADEAHSLAERALSKLNLNIEKFKTSLEKSNPGITDLLEIRSRQVHVAKVGRKKGVLNTSSMQPSFETHQKLEEQYEKEKKDNEEMEKKEKEKKEKKKQKKLAQLAKKLAPEKFQAIYGPDPDLKRGMGTAAIADAAIKAVAATQQLQERRRNVNVRDVDVYDLGFREQDVYATRQLFGNADINGAAKQAFVATLGPAAIFGEDDQTRNSTDKFKKAKPNRPGLFQPSAQGFSKSAVDTDKWLYDPNPNGPRYCICNEISYGEMVACDNVHCPIEWFHFSCMEIITAPAGKWYCPQCTNEFNMKKRGRLFRPESTF